MNALILYWFRLSGFNNNFYKAISRTMNIIAFPGLSGKKHNITDGPF